MSVQSLACLFSSRFGLLCSDFCLHAGAFAGNDGAILEIPVKVLDTVEEKTYDLSLTQVQVNSPDASDVVQNLSKDAPTVNFTLKVGDPTGINSINAEDSKAPVYNLAGQRVSKAQQGVFIQNGKKVAVK